MQCHSTFLPNSTWNLFSTSTRSQEQNGERYLNYNIADDIPFFKVFYTTIFPIIERDLVGIDAQTSRLIFMVSEADLVSENETDPTILLSKSICKQFPEINVESDLLDAHLYVFKKWVCDYIKENEYVNSGIFCIVCIIKTKIIFWFHRSLLTLKGEVLPRIVREQFSKQKNRNIEDLPNPNVSVVSMKTENRGIENSYSFFSFWLSAKHNNWFLQKTFTVLLATPCRMKTPYWNTHLGTTTEGIYVAHIKIKAFAALRTLLKMVFVCEPTHFPVTVSINLIPIYSLLL